MLRLANLSTAEASLYEMVCGHDQAEPLLDAVNQLHVAVRVCAVYERKLDGRATVAAVENDEELAGRWQSRDKQLVKGVASDLAVSLKVDRDDCIIETGVTVTIRISDLPTVARVVQEALAARL